MMLFRRLREARGQALVLMVVATTTILLATAVAIDGGNAVAQQREVQNGTDAASLAGAVVLGNYAACSYWGCATPTDAKVRTAINQAATANDIDPVPLAYYTDACGMPLKVDGTAAKSGSSVNLALAARVGAGTIPTDRGTTPNCTTGVSGPARGVLVKGHRNANTFIAGMVGISTFSIDTQATGVSTYGLCAASQGCALLPIVVPVNITSCDGSNKAIPGTTPWLDDTIYVIPLCKDGPGNVGWVDWTGQGKAGVPDAVRNGANPGIVTPSWQDVGLTGNMNSNGWDEAFWSREGDTVRVAMYDYTCGDDTDSSFPTINDPTQNYGCDGPLGGGNGQNLSYRIPRIRGFVLCEQGMAGCPLPHDAYIQGSHKTECGVMGGNGGTSCIIGKFVDVGDLDSSSGNSSPVQLIK